MKEAERNMIIVGGEGHKTGEGDDGAERFENLEDWARNDSLCKTSSSDGLVK
jgi:hypothetical protein